MEERKPMHEFDLGFMGKVICTADTAETIQNIVIIALSHAQKYNIEGLVNEYNKTFENIFDTLMSLGYYNESL